MYKSTNKFRVSFKTINGLDIGIPENNIKKPKNKKKKGAKPVKVSAPNPAIKISIELPIDPNRAIKIIKFSDREEKNK